MRGGDARTEGLDPNARRTDSESRLDGNLEKAIEKPCLHGAFGRLAASPRPTAVG